MNDDDIQWTPDFAPAELSRLKERGYFRLNGDPERQRVIREQVERERIPELEDRRQPHKCGVFCSVCNPSGGAAGW